MSERHVLQIPSCSPLSRFTLFLRPLEVFMCARVCIFLFVCLFLFCCVKGMIDSTNYVIFFFLSPLLFFLALSFSLNLSVILRGLCVRVPACMCVNVCTFRSVYVWVCLYFTIFRNSIWVRATFSSSLSFQLFLPPTTTSAHHCYFLLLLTLQMCIMQTFALSWYSVPFKQCDYKQNTDIYI